MWWEKAVFYEIYLPSFYDSNQDGIGDFKGIQEKIPYLEKLGVDGLWLTPFYPSPKIDNGYDVADYCGVDPQYGTLQDLEQLIKEAKKRGLRIIIDVVFNHTSTAHPWFQEGLQNPASPKREWYIWRDEPNNWESFFGGSAWEYDENSQQYYYHSFAKEQADLNWRNPEVKEAIYQILEFWIAKGVSGFRFDVINNLSTAADFTDNPYDKSGNQIHQYDVNQTGVMGVLKEINTFIKTRDPKLFTVAEISSDQLAVIEQYVGEDLFDTAFNFNLGSQKTFDPAKLVHELKTINEANSSKLPTLFFNSHDMSRSFNRLAEENSACYRLLTVLLMINHGVTFLFQGEELGLGDFIPETITDIRDIQAKNKYGEVINELGAVVALKEANLVNRDRSRGMLPWQQDSGWIGAAVNNFEEKEIFSWYQELIRIRHEEGPFLPLENIRIQNGQLTYNTGNYLIVLNFSDQETIFTPVSGEIRENIWRCNSPKLKNNKIYLPPWAGWIGKIRV